jgi:hypothetical protein
MARLLLASASVEDMRSGNRWLLQGPSRRRRSSSKIAMTMARAPPRSSKVARLGRNRKADQRSGGRWLLLPHCVTDDELLPRFAATAIGSSSLFTWPMAASFLNA